MNINELATISMGQRKNKNMAFDTIIKIIEQSDSIKNVSIGEYKNLYAFFSLPTTQKKDKWSWINTFCSKDATKEYFHTPWVDKKYIYATNGFILVRSVNDLSLAPGRYDKNKIKIENISRLPDGNLVLEPYDFSDSQLFTGEIKQKPYMNYKTLEQAYYFDSIPNNIFNKKLYDTATAYTGLVNKKYYLGQKTPLVIGTPDLCVAIMPKQ
jgi:hypothetical protein